MAEIRLDVDYSHPVDRVWCALTDPRITEQWFVPGTLGTTVGGQYQLRPRETDGLAGPIDVEVLEVVQNQRLVMQWTGERLHTEMTWVLMPTAEGCRLSIVQSGFIGTPQSVRRLELRQAYTALFTQALPPVLGRMAAGAVDLREERSLPPPAAVPRRPSPRSHPAGGPAGYLAHLFGGPGRWRAVGTGAAILALLVLAVVVLVVGLRNGDSGHEAQPLPQPLDGTSLGPEVSVGGARAGAQPGGTRQSAVPSASIAILAPALANNSAAPGAGGNGAAPGSTGGTGAGTARLSAAYQTTKVNGQGSYTGRIDIVNIGSGTASGWSVVITLSGTTKVTDAQQASFGQSGQTVTFTPAGNGTVVAGGSTWITFNVNRKKDPATAPLSCTVNGDACSM